MRRSAAPARATAATAGNDAAAVGGGYASTAIGSGRNRWYSEKNWGRRWMVEGVGSGWLLELAV